MSDATLAVKIMTQRAELAVLEAAEVNLPATDGYLGILAGHAPLIATIGVGLVSLRVNNATPPPRYFVASGIFSVTDNRVQILADVAESQEQIDLDRAQASQARAEQRLKDARHRGDIDIERASAALQRAFHRVAFVREGGAEKILW